MFADKYKTKLKAFQLFSLSLDLKHLFEWHACELQLVEIIWPNKLQCHFSRLFTFVSPNKCRLPELVVSMQTATQIDIFDSEDGRRPAEGG